MKKLLAVLLALVLVLSFTACGAETEPVRESSKKNNTPATFDPTDVTEREIKEGDTIIIKVSVYHGDGEVSDTRISAVYGQTLSEVLLERTYITADMKTVDGEYANEALGASWTLYVDGVFTTAGWDTVVVENNSEYMFEYTSDVSLEGAPEVTDEENVGGDEEIEVPENTEDNFVGEPEV